MNLESQKEVFRGVKRWESEGTAHDRKRAECHHWCGDKWLRSCRLWWYSAPKRCLLCDIAFFLHQLYKLYSGLQCKSKSSEKKEITIIIICFSNSSGTGPATLIVIRKLTVIPSRIWKQKAGRWVAQPREFKITKPIVWRRLVPFAVASRRWKTWLTAAARRRLRQPTGLSRAPLSAAREIRGNNRQSGTTGGLSLKMIGKLCASARFWLFQSKLLVGIK